MIRKRTGMKIRDLLYGIEYTGSLSDEALGTDTDFVTDDSRKVREGCVFVATRGAVFDGNTFITRALEMGAALIVTEDEPKNGRTVRVPDSRMP